MVCYASSMRRCSFVPWATPSKGGEAMDLLFALAAASSIGSFLISLIAYVEGRVSTRNKKKKR